MKSSSALSTTFFRASEVLARVYEGQSLADVGILEPAVQDLCYSSLRDYSYAEAVYAPLLRKPIAEPKIRALLACALREIGRGRAGHFTIVSEAVEACVLLDHAAAKSFVNAVLRNYLRQREALEQQALHTSTALWRHPQWWIDALRAHYPQHWESILAAGNQHPPMALRVNRRKIDLQNYAAQLEEAAIPARAVGSGAFLLSTPRAIAQIPGFAEGQVSVQDIAAQYAASLLDLKPGMRVLDACAAPGGKTAHILECEDVELVAIDRDERRAALIAANLDRLGLRARVHLADAADLAAWWDGKSYDRILLDAPCSASGVARRHPDIKWLRRADDLYRFAVQQGRLLEALWQVLAPSGKLLYVTCSVFPEENALQIADFMARHKNIKRLALPAPLPADGQLLPDQSHDGFYYALLEKTAAA